MSLDDLNKLINELSSPLSVTDEVSDSLQKIAEERMVQCDHGVVFDEIEAKKMQMSSKNIDNVDPIVNFIMGPSSSSDIRKKWPRLHGQCPKGCGFNGIAYASYMHYLMGDW